MRYLAAICAILLAYTSVYADTTCNTNVTTSPVQLVGQNAQRHYLLVSNSGASAVLVCEGAGTTCSGGVGGVLLQGSGGYWEPPCVQPAGTNLTNCVPPGPITVFTLSGTTQVCVIQY